MDYKTYEATLYQVKQSAAQSYTCFLLSPAELSGPYF